MRREWSLCLATALLCLSGNTASVPKDLRTQIKNKKKQEDNSSGRKLEPLLKRGVGAKLQLETKAAVFLGFLHQNAYGSTDLFTLTKKKEPFFS